MFAFRCCMNCENADHAPDVKLWTVYFIKIDQYRKFRVSSSNVGIRLNLACNIVIKRQVSETSNVISNGAVLSYEQSYPNWTPPVRCKQLSLQCVKIEKNSSPITKNSNRYYCRVNLLLSRVVSSDNGLRTVFRENCDNRRWWSRIAWHLPGN